MTEEVVCFKYLDDEMEKAEGDKKAFCKLFEQKLSILKKMQEKKITAEDYKNALDKIIEDSDKYHFCKVVKTWN